MSDHTDWVKTKAKAKKANGNKAFKFPRDVKLGAALDKVAASQKVYAKAGEKGFDAAWAKAADAYFEAVGAANRAAITYHQALPNMELTSEARSILNSELSVNYMRNLTVIQREGKRLEPRLARVRE